MTFTQKKPQRPSFRKGHCILYGSSTGGWGEGWSWFQHDSDRHIEPSLYCLRVASLGWMVSQGRRTGFLRSLLNAKRLLQDTKIQLDRKKRLNFFASYLKNLQWVLFFKGRILFRWWITCHRLIGFTSCHHDVYRYAKMIASCCGNVRSYWQNKPRWGFDH